MGDCIRRGGAFFPKIGEVYMMYFEGQGCVQSGWRPGVIFQNNIGNKHSPNIIALPFTTSLKKIDQPTHVLVDSRESGLRYTSMILCENPQCLPKGNIGKYLTTLPYETMGRVAKAHLAATGALAFVDLKTLIGSWQKAADMSGQTA